VRLGRLVIMLEFPEIYLKIWFSICTVLTGDAAVIGKINKL